MQGLRARISELERENATLRSSGPAALIDDHVVCFDSDWHFTFVNEAAERMLGKPAHELLGKVIWEMWPESVGNQYYRDLQEAVRTRKVIRRERFYKPWDMWVLNHIYPSAGGVTVLTTEITDRKRAEEQLRMSEERYRALVDSTSQLVWTWNPVDKTGDHSAVQNWWHELTGQSPHQQSEAQATGWMEAIHPSDRERVFDQWTSSMAEAKPFSSEYRVITPSGAILHLVSKAVPIKEGDSVREWVGTMEDVTAIRQSEESRDHAVQRFEAVILASPLAILVMDREAKVELWNPMAEQMFGWKAAEVVGEPLPTIPASEQGIFESHLERVLGGEIIREKLYKRQRKDGSVFDARIWSVPLTNRIGETFGILAIVADVSAELKTEEALRHSQEALKLAMRGGGMGYWTRDLRTGVVEWSPELEALFGIPEGTFGGDEEAFFRFVHKDDLPDLSEAVQESIRTGKDYSVEFRFFKADGSLRWMDGRGRATLDENGQAIRIDGFGIDITDRKEAETALHDSERRFRMFVEMLPVIGWSLDAHGTMDFINRRYTEYTGLDVTNSPGEAWGKVVHPADRERAYDTYKEAVANGQPWTCELRVRNKEGEYRWHLSRLEPIRDIYGNLLRWFATSTDIHAQKEAEEELERRVTQRTAALTDAISELEGFTYTVSHDLRAPLRAINASSKILLDEAGDSLSEEQRGLLERQAHNAKRLGVLIDELLKLSRLNRTEIAREEIDMTELANEVIIDLESREWPSNLTFRVQPGMKAMGDAKQVRFVLINLLENACKFSPNGGLVEVGQEEAAIFVKDRGIGFDERYSDKLFLPFERLVTDDQFPGTGIGLANAHRIVQRHGGRIWAESKLGNGATFYFTLGQ